MNNLIKITKVSDALEFLQDESLTYNQISMITRKSKPTLYRWANLLRKAGHEVPHRKSGGLNKLEI